MANEKRLIDANELLEMVQFRLPIDNKNAEIIAGCVDIARRYIENAPTVDAVEVVHGRWEDEYGGKYANPRYRCSVCKEKANYKFVQDELLSWHDVQVLTPYCPYCMTKLDGGIDNDIKTV